MKSATITKSVKRASSAGSFPAKDDDIGYGFVGNPFTRRSLPASPSGFFSQLVTTPRRPEAKTSYSPGPLREAISLTPPEVEGCASAFSPGGSLNPLPSLKPGL